MPSPFPCSPSRCLPFITRFNVPVFCHLPTVSFSGCPPKSPIAYFFMLHSPIRSSPPQTQLSIKKIPTLSNYLHVFIHILIRSQPRNRRSIRDVILRGRSAAGRVHLEARPAQKGAGASAVSFVCLVGRVLCILKKGGKDCVSFRLIVYVG